MAASIGMLKVKEAAKSLSWLASQLGITRGAVSQWSRVPAERVLEVERVTGVPRFVQRPDIYPVPTFPSAFSSPSGHYSPASCNKNGSPAASCHANPAETGLRAVAR